MDTALSIYICYIISFMHTEDLEALWDDSRDLAGCGHDWHLDTISCSILICFISFFSSSPTLTRCACLMWLAT